MRRKNKLLRRGAKAPDRDSEEGVAAKHRHKLNDADRSAHC
jgi:hypothetical protein